MHFQERFSSLSTLPVESSLSALPEESPDWGKSLTLYQRTLDPLCFVFVSFAMQPFYAAAHCKNSTKGMHGTEMIQSSFHCSWRWFSHLVLIKFHHGHFNTRLKDHWPLLIIWNFTLLWEVISEIPIFLLDIQCISQCTVYLANIGTHNFWCQYIC